MFHSSTVAYMSHWDNLKAWHMLVDCHISCLKIPGFVATNMSGKYQKRWLKLAGL